MFAVTRPNAIGYLLVCGLNLCDKNNPEPDYKHNLVTRRKLLC